MNAYLPLFFATMNKAVDGADKGKIFAYTACMSKILTKIACVVLALFLSPFLFGNTQKKEEGIKEITKPYIGTYECERLMFGGEDCTEKFVYFRVELTGDGQFIVRAKDKKGKKHGGAAAYRAEDEEGKFVLFQKRFVSTKKIPFEIHGGEKTLSTRFGPKMVSILLKMQ